MGLAGANPARWGASDSKTSGKGTAKGRRFAPSFCPAFPRCAAPTALVWSGGDGTRRGWEARRSFASSEQVAASNPLCVWVRPAPAVIENRNSTRNLDF